MIGETVINDPKEKNRRPVAFNINTEECTVTTNHKLTFNWTFYDECIKHSAVCGQISAKIWYLKDKPASAVQLVYEVTKVWVSQLCVSL